MKAVHLHTRPGSRRPALALGLFILSASMAAGGTLDPRVAGLKQTLIRAGDPVQTDARRARLIAIRVPEGDVVSPFLQAGPFISRWEGEIDLKINDAYVFSAEGRGAVTVGINGRKVLESRGPLFDRVDSKEITMRKGPNPIRVTYRSPSSGTAWLRLYWWNPIQPREPLSPEVFRCRRDRDLRLGERRRRGRWLLATRLCVRCHLDPGSLSPTAMPELSKRAPLLTGIGRRLNQGWMTRWLTDPRALRADALMPRLLHGTRAGVERQARDIAAFLATQTSGASGEPVDLKVLADPGQVEAGSESYLTLGCMTCHRLPGDTRLEPDPRISLERIQEKWKPAALVRYLRHPLRNHPWSRMPDFRLRGSAASSLAAYLLSRTQRALQSAGTAEGDPVQGRLHVARLGCLNCHELGEMKSRLRAPALNQISSAPGLRGCLADSSGSRGHPVYELTRADREAISEVLIRDRESMKRRAWSEFAHREIAALRCVSCHAFDGRSDLWSTLIATEASAEGSDLDGEGDLIRGFGDAFDDEPEGGETNIHRLRPPLTWAGEKLYADWMERFIAGRLRYKPRARLKARMPGFPAYAHGLALGLTLDHGFDPARPARVPVTPASVEVGRRLVQAERFGCVSCHALGDQGALAGPESEAINLKYVPDRLRRHYFDRFVLDPKRLLPGTMMPNFVDERGNSPVRDILDGKAAKQFEAIWNYLQSLGETAVSPLRSDGHGP